MPHGPALLPQPPETKAPPAVPCWTTAAASAVAEPESRAGATVAPRRCFPRVPARVTRRFRCAAPRAMSAGLGVQSRQHRAPAPFAELDLSLGAAPPRRPQSPYPEPCQSAHLLMPPPQAATPGALLPDRGSHRPPCPPLPPLSCIVHPPLHVGQNYFSRWIVRSTVLLPPTAVYSVRLEISAPTVSAPSRNLPRPLRDARRPFFHPFLSLSRRRHALLLLLPSRRSRPAGSTLPAHRVSPCQNCSAMPRRWPALRASPTTLLLLLLQHHHHHAASSSRRKPAGRAA
ncbi:uncharacterized protein [Miscanthus floridulus]|uniref:uncharacterized protein n=1 Tax=Miscanthus floridulus TaxID=154761 RepID=UPI003459ADB0